METPSLGLELAVGGGMVLLTTLVHGAGLIFLRRALRLETIEEIENRIRPMSFRALMATTGLVLGLFLLHGFEIALYGWLYMWLGAVKGMEPAMYFSTMTYGTVGFSDKLLVGPWRLIAAIEGVNGLLLIGWSTAFFVTLATRLGRFQ